MNLTHALFVAALLPVSAMAGDFCTVSQPRALDLDMSGVKTVVFEVNGNALNLQASPGAKAALTGRACASSQGQLGQLSLTQEKTGDKITVRLKRETPGIDFSFGADHVWLDMSGTLPDTVMVQLKVGSGDAWLEGAQAASVDVGSGDVQVNRVKQQVTAAVGSGDLKLDDIGALNLLSVGSGDVHVNGVRGDATVGSIGSGDLEVRNAQGNVQINAIGSGDATVSEVQGAVNLDAMGSGDLHVRNAGSLRVRRVGSGSVEHSGIRGSVDVPKDD